MEIRSLRASARLTVGEISAADLSVYDRVLPQQSLLLDCEEFVDWEQFLPDLISHYSTSPDGQPPYPPLILLKLEFLGHLYGLGRRRLIERATYDLHWKYFLGLPIAAVLPDHSTLSLFRSRIGAAGFVKLFDKLISIARGYGLVSDKLRLKDATHVYADIAVPTAMGLFAQLRDRMLAAVREFDRSAAESFDVDLELMRQRSEGAEAPIRLEARVEIVRDILAWIIEQKAPTDPSRERAWKKLLSVKALAEKILSDQANPQGGDKTISVVDSDARCGKHGEFYNGYLLDIMIDSESQLITGLDVLPANADEARNAVALVQAEEQAQGNDIEQLSIDGIGFNGEVLQTLTDPAGLDLDVFTPPRNFTTTAGFDPSEFELIDDGQRVRCPAGEVSGKGGRKADNPNTVFYTFSRSKCASCPLLAACHPTFNPEGRQGRRVPKNEYEQDYQQAREVAQTPEYADVRHRHPAVERKLNELVRHHNGRRAIYRGRSRVKIQQILIAMAVNVKRMAKLLRGQCAPTAALAGI